MYVLRAVADDGAAASQGLSWIAVGRLGVYVEEWVGPREVTREGMLRHHEVVSAIHGRVDCLPARFPTWSADPASLDLARFEAALERVRGKSEFAITLAWESSLLPLGEGQDEGVTRGRRPRPHPGPLPEGEGTKYLHRRRDYWAARREREEAVRAWVEQLPAERQVRICPNDRVAASAALLVPRGTLPAIPPLAGTRCVVNGPWPPYTFATVVE